MATPITDDERQAIIADLTAGKSVHATADAHGRAKGSVAKIAREAGIDSSAVARSRVARASEARRAVGEERRAALASKAADRLDEVMGRMGGPSHEVVLTREGPEVIEVPAGGREWRDWTSAARSLQQTMLDLVRYDERGDEDMSAVDDWLRHVQGG